MSASVYILGGSQSDFARNWAREGLDIYAMFRSCLEQGLAATGLDPDQIEVGHVGNFAGDLFAGQGLLGGFFAQAFPELNGVPTTRHEAACASGSMALLGAIRDIRCGDCDLACVLGLEYMRNVPGKTGADYLGAATWKGVEAQHCDYPWPFMFSRIIDEYERRHGIDTTYLRAITKLNFANARKNPRAQSRNWQFEPEFFTDSNIHNPIIEGRIRKSDCGQITDGAACVFVASERAAKAYARQHNLSLRDIPRIKGWGHRSAAIELEAKLHHSDGNPLLFPHIQQLLSDALTRAKLGDITDLDGLEVHDCFSITEYMVIDHCGLTAPGESWKAIEEGRIAADGDLPINASGGLIGLGHPVGATGVRMVLDCHRQVTGQAGDYQIAGAKNMGTFNLGGSATTCASFIVGVDT
ncbi:acetyl-CoA acetyltransferase [Microbulbifer sp. 2304DJ12-6]|uniref:acetyl-CoA acetyltransferase n=1 Tax=Microbulbifer sp. 2304DJ12-6 TaxID=3233340 RepID=UPI0039B01FAB